MRTFNRGVENLKYLMAKHEAEWRIEKGEEGVKVPTLENFASTPIKPPRKSESNLPENRFLSSAEPKVESVQVLENSGKHHSWLYNEVMKAINDAAAKNKNSRIIAIFVPVLQDSGEFKDLPVDETITINKPDNSQESGITEEGDNDIVDITSVLPPLELEQESESDTESPEPEESSAPESEKLDDVAADEPSEELNAIESPVDEDEDIQVVPLEEIHESSEEEESPELESPEELNESEILPAVEEPEPESESEPEEVILIEEPAELKELDTPDEIVEILAAPEEIAESEQPSKLTVIEEEPAELDSDLAELENLDDSITEEPVLLLPDDDEEIKIEEAPEEILLDSDSHSDGEEIEILPDIPPLDDDEKKRE